MKSHSLPSTINSQPSLLPPSGIRCQRGRQNPIQILFIEILRENMIAQRAVSANAMQDRLYSGVTLIALPPYSGSYTRLIHELLSLLLRSTLVLEVNDQTQQAPLGVIRINRIQVRFQNVIR